MSNTDKRLSVCPEALAIPTHGPMDSFNASTWPACYVEWWFGDGAPGLDRERPMLFEQVARRLLDVEEREYRLDAGEMPCVASAQSCFNAPEIIAVLGEVVRRVRLFKGARAAIGRRGFDADLKALASAACEANLRREGAEVITPHVVEVDAPATAHLLRALVLHASDLVVHALPLLGGVRCTRGAVTCPEKSRAR